MQEARAQQLFAFLIFGGIVAAAFSVGERYPLARFHMFDHRTQAASRVIARVDGEAHELDGLTSFYCMGPVELFTGPSDGPRRCDIVAAYPEVERRLERRLSRERASSPQTVPIEIVRRTFTFPDPYGPAEVTDCVIGLCSGRWRE